MIASYMKEIYQKFHQNPEPPFQEIWTSELIAQELIRLGFEVKTGIGRTGVVGVLHGSAPGPHIAFRSDMDALPIEENTSVSYASKNAGMMHACGHDSHMAVLLACCQYAAGLKDELKGTVQVVFQPAEEIVEGAKAMLAEGLFSDKKPDYMFALHNWPHIPVGSVGIQAGPLTAYSGRFEAVFKGVGGHGAFPHKAKDPIAMATSAVQSAYTLVQRYSNPQGARVMSVGLIRGGSSFNVIPDRVTIEGTVRALQRSEQEKMVELLHQAFGAAARLYAGSYELLYEEGVPAVVNDRELARQLVEMLGKSRPELSVLTSDLASLIGEDVAYFFNLVPGVLIFIGSGQEEGINELHHPEYLVPEQTLHVGLKVLSSIVDHFCRN